MRFIPSVIAGILCAVTFLTVSIGTAYSLEIEANGQQYREHFEGNSSSQMRLNKITLYKEYDPRDEFPSPSSNLNYDEITAQFEKFEPSAYFQSIHSATKQLLTDDYSALPSTKDVKSYEAFWVARLGALNRLGLFDEVLRLYQEWKKSREKIPSDVALEAIKAYAYTGQKDGFCLETHLASSVLTIDPWVDLKIVCDLYMEEEPIDSALLTISPNINTALSVLWQPEKYAAQTETIEPHIYTALSRQSDLSDLKRLKYGGKAIREGAMSSGRLLDVINNSDIKGLTIADVNSVDRVLGYYFAYLKQQDAEDKKSAIIDGIAQTYYAERPPFNDELAKIWVGPLASFAEMASYEMPDLAKTARPLLKRFDENLLLDLYRPRTKEEIDIYMTERFNKKDEDKAGEKEQESTDDDIEATNTENEELLQVEEPHPMLVLQQFLKSEYRQPSQTWFQLKKSLEQEFPKSSQRRLRMMRDILQLYGHRAPSGLVKTAKKSEKVNFSTPKKVTDRGQGKPFLTLLETISLLDSVKSTNRPLLNILNYLEFIKNDMNMTIFDKITLEILLQNGL